MHILNGNEIAERIISSIRKDVDQTGISPVFSAILVGDDPASHLYVNLKEKAAVRAGIVFQKKIFSGDIGQEQLLQEIYSLNDDASVHGILVQLPLPSHIHTQDIIDAIDPEKDVDGFHPVNAELFLKGKEFLTPVFPRAIMELIRSTQESLAGKRAVVVGNGDIFGNMMLAALSRERIVGEFIKHNMLRCRQASVLAADIIVTACGEPNLITGDMVKNGAIVIDGGITKTGDKVVGDVDVPSVQNKDIWLSLVPGGVGPVTIACLLENVHKSSKANVGIRS